MAHPQNTTGTQDDDRNSANHNQPDQHAPPTQKNEARRTPESRNDREGHVGGSNQIQNRKGAPAGRH